LIYKVNNESYDDLVVGIGDRKDSSYGKICEGKTSDRFYLLWDLIAAICWPSYFIEVIF